MKEICPEKKNKCRRLLRPPASFNLICRTEVTSRSVGRGGMITDDPLKIQTSLQYLPQHVLAPTHPRPFLIVSHASFSPSCLSVQSAPLSIYPPSLFASFSFSFSHPCFPTTGHPLSHPSPSLSHSISRDILTDQGISTPRQLFSNAATGVCMWA